MPSELVKRFCEESLDSLRSISSDILAIERNGDVQQIYAEILRKLHSMKGSARMLGLTEIGEVIHATEDVISLVAQSPDDRPDELVNMLLLISDSLQEALVAVHDDDVMKPLDQLTSGIETVQMMLLDRLHGRLDELAAHAPEVFSVLNAQQRETLLRNLSRYQQLFVIHLSFRRESFADDVRAVHAALNENGLLVSTTGTKSPPEPGFDLKFLFLAFSNENESSLREKLARYEPGFVIVPAEGMKAAMMAAGAAGERVQSEPRTAVSTEPAQTAPTPSTIPHVQAGTAARQAQPHPDPEFVQLQRMFLDEGEEHLKVLSKDILSLERTPSLETVNSIFRSFHNLKGSGGSYSFVNISRIAHILESFVQPMRVDVRAVTPLATGKMLRGVDVLEKVFEYSRLGRHDEVPIEQFEQELRDILANTPEPGKPEDASAAPSKPRAQARQHSVRTPDSMRVNLRKIDTIVNAAVELSIAHNAEQYLLSNFADIVEHSQRQLHLWQTLRDMLIQQGFTLPENLLLEMNEFTVALSGMHRKLGDLGRAVETNFALWTSLASALGADVLQLQLQPLSTLFEIFDRIVRDLSHSLGKMVDLEIQGGDVEVDRRIIDALKDPFVHLLRNSIDHGIEAPDVRTAAGKPERGAVRVTAQQMGFSFSISITDDGRGLDRTQIEATAVARSLITREQAAMMSDAEVYRLLFRPGFSTRETVSDISGRGVGLDVVATNVHQFGGEVFVSTTANGGTTFQIILPTTLTLSRVLLIEAGDRLFSFPVTGTEQIVLLTPDSLQSFYGRIVTMWNEQFIPVIDIEDLLALPRSSRRVRNGLILRTGESMLCLSVPRVTDETELMTKPLPPHLRGNRIITGANVLADGRIALFINPRAVTDKPVHSAKPAYESRPVPPAIAERKRILVVDDSLIARELLRNILLASGYDVSLACDGQEALQHLRSHVTDLVLTDIDMPGMDGLTFTRTVKHDATLRRVPVIIVSSKEDEAQRARGMDAGADAYILKGDFHQNNLLATVKRLLAGDVA